MGASTDSFLEDLRAWLAERDAVIVGSFDQGLQFEIGGDRVSSDGNPVVSIGSNGISRRLDWERMTTGATQ